MPTDFEKAFAEARAKGLAQFSFNGKQYTTQLKEEPAKLLQLALTDKIRNEAAKEPLLKYVSNYNTGLNQQEFNEFWNWAKQRRGTQDDVLWEMGNYDLQGYWKAAKQAELKRKQGQRLEDWEQNLSLDPKGHLIDMWKKPNHPTFSNESRYHSKQTPGGQWKQVGNRWQYYPSKYTLQNFGKNYIKSYLDADGDTETDVMWNNPVDF